MLFNIEQYQILQKACPACNIVVVTKYQNLSTTQQVIDAGVKYIAESKIQDAKKKKSKLTGFFYYHFIGHLQSNKAKEAVQLFDMIQSVDSFKLLQILQKEAKQQNKILPILLQANFSNESQKYGFSLTQLHDAIAYAQQASHLNLQGCMCIGKQNDQIVTHLCFQWLRHICNVYALPICSMGMSHDRQDAYRQGSTMLRIGNLLFNKEIDGKT